jgi:hypothetical protein
MSDVLFCIFITGKSQRREMFKWRPRMHTATCLLASASQFATAAEIAWGGQRTYGEITRLTDAFLHFEVDISRVPCGMVAALYFVALPLQNVARLRSDACAPYCDANAVCGISCAELDVMEANRHAFRSTVHGAHDPGGRGCGQGGEAEADAWPPGLYGAAAACVDTTKPFALKFSYRVEGPEVFLRQGTCELHLQLPPVPADFDASAKAGVIPVLSLWSEPGATRWLDGGACGLTPDPCPAGALACANVTFSATSRTTQLQVLYQTPKPTWPLSLYDPHSSAVRALVLPLALTSASFAFLALTLISRGAASIPPFRIRRSCGELLPQRECAPPPEALASSQWLPVASLS